MNALISSPIVRIVAFLALVLMGCAARSPQQQVIPAVMDGDIAKVELLLNDTAHVDINWRAGGKGVSALITAAGHNQFEIAQLLLRRGADPSLATVRGFSPLHAAAAGGNFEIVRLLLDSGANPNTAETRHGFGPLASAASKGYTEIVKLLLDAGADRSATGKDGRDAAEIARQSGHAETLRVLLSHQAKPMAGIAE